MTAAVTELTAAGVPTRRACTLTGTAPATWYRRRVNHDASPDAPARASPDARARLGSPCPTGSAR